MNYKVVDWFEANDMVSQKDAVFLMQIEYNSARVFLRQNLFIVLGINPFSKAIITESRSLLDSWIDNRNFPTGEPLNSFDNKYQILITDLPQHFQAFVSKIEADTDVSIHSDTDIDTLYQKLQTQNKVEELKLSFVIAVGNFLLSKKESETLGWGLLRIKQFLNPLTTIVLVKQDDDGVRYFELENKLTGKWGFSSSDWLMHSFNKKWRIPNDFEELVVF